MGAVLSLSVLSVLFVSVSFLFVVVSAVPSVSLFFLSLVVVPVVVPPSLLNSCTAHTSFFGRNILVSSLFADWLADLVLCCRTERKD